MRYQVKISKEAEKYIKKLSKPDAIRIMSAINGLADDPFPPGHKLLTNHEYTYRLRVGSYRILYDVDSGVLLVHVGKVGPRGDVYNN